MAFDRRRADRDRRLSRRVPAVFAVRSLAARASLLGQAEDIGVAGMTLRWPRDTALVLPSLLALIFELPGCPDQIAARATVVSQRSAGRYRRTGVRFTALDPEHAALIAAYCARRM